MAKRAKGEPSGVSVGARMRKWRKLAGMSQEEVGKIIGCGKANISLAENGKQNLSLPAFLSYCQAINAPVSKVLEERLLERHRDVDRLAADLAEHPGVARELEWLASLSRAEFRHAMQAARDRVDLERLRATVHVLHELKPK